MILSIYEENNKIKKNHLYFDTKARSGLQSGQDSERTPIMKERMYRKKFLRSFLPGKLTSNTIKYKEVI